MSLLDREGKTICALATAPGVGGLSVIRVSGHTALKTVAKICPFLNKELEHHKVYYGFLVSLENKEEIDEVVVTYFKDGHSFTGEETLEISCHGGNVISNRILKELVSCGALVADKGEFTYRAFSNGRIDLVQAESVLSLIESGTEKAAKQALRQLKGELSQSYFELRDNLQLILAHLEANIDFAAEDIVIEENNSLICKVEALMDKVKYLHSSYNKGRKITDGIQISLVGRPNVGKSSLLNRIVREDKAIVTPIAGTTRDIVEAQLRHDGFNFYFSDTAGLRETDDQVEQIGIERSFKRAKESDVTFFLFDVNDLNTDDFKYLKQIENKEIYFIANKSDLGSDGTHVKEFLIKQATIFNCDFDFSSIADDRFILTSVTKNSGIEHIKAWLSVLAQSNLADDSAVVTQVRHYERLSELMERLDAAINLLKNDESPEFIAFELHVGLKKIYEILGLEYEDQVMDTVFSEFCLGK